uniref:Macaca fascicularis brain cDNA clone: QflA-18862, similar to human Mdm2, transformed 3T3 cell double minute 2, p53 bindingprotein (mouse) (MDM2), transcript variant MDM2d, mRNA, RefSeq: NM_006881.2 n=1 Tax=Macaca fascicularis TaxID=9541 RepID=I7GCB3_MACFA|nr:unnamed protein product [Macaca fascicularis]
MSVKFTHNLHLYIQPLKRSYFVSILLSLYMSCHSFFHFLPLSYLLVFLLMFSPFFFICSETLIFVGSVCFSTSLCTFLVDLSHLSHTSSALQMCSLAPLCRKT